MTMTVGAHKWEGKDEQGQQYARVSDVRAAAQSNIAHYVKFDEGFDCLQSGVLHALHDAGRGPYVNCQYGTHYLSGSECNGFYIGVYGPFAQGAATTST